MRLACTLSHDLSYTIDRYTKLNFKQRKEKRVKNKKHGYILLRISHMSREVPHREFEKKGHGI